MVSQIRDGIGAMFTKIQDFGSSVVETGSAALKSAASAVTAKVNECASVIKEKIVEQAPVFEAAQRAAENVTNGVTGALAKTAARVYIRTCASDATIEGFRNELRKITQSDQLANTVTRVVPHLLTKVKDQLGEDNKYASILDSENVSCGKILEAKMLEVLLQISKKTEIRGSENSEHVTMQMIEQLLSITANQLENPGQDPKILHDDLKGVAQWLMSKGANFAQEAIANAFLADEASKNPELLNGVKVVANELLEGLGLSNKGGSASLENVLLGLVNTVMKDGASKLIYHMNEKLFSLNDKINNSETSELPVADFINDLCKTAAKDATNTVFENLFPNAEKPENEQAKETVNGQKGFIERMLDKLLSFAFKWVLNTLGLIDNGSSSSKSFSWTSIFKKPFEFLSRYFQELRKTQDEKDEAKRSRKQEVVFENLMEEMIGDTFASWLQNNVAAFKAEEKKKEEATESVNADAEYARKVNEDFIHTPGGFAAES